MENVFLISWILGVTLSIIFAVMAWILKDKKAWETFPYMFGIALFTGYITTIPIICAAVLIILNKRFEK